MPRAKAGKRTKPVLEYELLAAHPYEYTEADVAFETYARLHGIPVEERAKARDGFTSKGHPRLRVSALAKRYGWGIHVNAEGKVALVAVESPDYQRLLRDPHVRKVKAFRSRRA